MVDAVDPTGAHAESVLRAGLLATDVDPASGGVSANALDAALWESRKPAPDVGPAAPRRDAAVRPHPARHVGAGRRRRQPGAGGQGRPRASAGPTATMCPPEAQQTLWTRCSPMAGGWWRWPARPAAGLTRSPPTTSPGSMLDGFLVFADEPKAAARDSLAQLAALGIEVKVATGDNPRVAEKVCADLGLASKGTDHRRGAGVTRRCRVRRRGAKPHHLCPYLPGAESAADRVVARRSGRSVGFLGDGVNDALALHAADVGISVDTATDVAKDAADVVLLEKDLGVLATGVAEGRRIFANTIKYVLMGTSSNFGNMFSAAAASALLPFLPMLPSQILLNNLLYDSSQLAIPTDRVDDEQLQAPSHWNIAFIRRFMLTFGPVSSLFDFLTFGLMLGVLHAGPVEFRTGWFVESLATQTLIIFAIRTRQVPFFRSRPSGVFDLATFRQRSPWRGAHRFTAGPQSGFYPAAVAILHRAGRR